MMRRESLVKTDGIFKLTNELDSCSVGASDGTDDTASVVSSPTAVSFPTAASNNIVSTLGLLFWDDEQISPEDEQPRLDFCSLKVCGRKEEIKTLQDAFDRIRVGHAEVVTVFGDAGSGKSTLVARALREYVPDREGFFVAGKFEQLRSKEPYSAIIEALSDLCDLIIQSGNLQPVRDELRTTLGADAIILCRLIGSNLKRIVKPDRSVTVSLEGSSMHNAFTRLQLLCRSFLRVVSTFDHPVVLFLDDIQWADKSSLKLIKSLVRDDQASHLLVVLAYRQDEKGRDLRHLLNSICSRVGDEEKAPGFPCTDINVSNLTLDGVNEIVADVTNLDIATARPLAECVKEKTMGNVFHVIHFLESLQNEDFLVQEHGRWKWDLNQIKSNTNVSDNVAELIAGKVKKQKTNVKLVLQLAGYLGSRFCVHVLEDIVFEEVAQSQDYTMSDDFFHQRFLWIISIATNEGLIEKCGKTEYKFSHDKVQRCLYNMVPAGSSREALHVAIGYILLKRLKRMEQPTRQMKNCQMFLAAEHFNRGRMNLETCERKLCLAHLNLEVANIAMSQAAFSLACDYLNNTIKLLPNPAAMWNVDRDLTIDVYSTLAECEYCDGNFELSDKACGHVVKHASSLEENIRIYYIMIGSFAARGRFRNALNLGFSILREMGEKFPRRPNMVHVMLEVAKARLVVTEHSDDHLLELPISQDPAVASKMKLLSYIAACAYQTSQHGKAFAVVSLRMMQITLREGHTKTSPHVFACYGVINVFLGRHEEGFRFGQLALRLLDQLDARETKARTLATTFLLVNHWRRPIREGIPFFESAYDVGRATGDIDYSFYGIVGKISSCFYSGRPLPTVEALIRKTARESVDFKKLNAFKLLAPMWQVCLNLMGRTTDPTILSGEAIDMENKLDAMEEDENRVAIFLLVYNQLKLCIYFECWDTAEEMLPLIEEKYKANKNHFSYPTSLFDRGLAYFELYRLRRRNQWLNKANKMSAQLETWANEGNVNCHGLAKLLRAEQMSFKGGLSDVMNVYDDAIRAFQIEGILHHEAVANERAACFLLERSLPEKAAEYLQSCIGAYNKWGAITKVKWLAVKYEDLLVSGSVQLEEIHRPKSVFTFTPSTDIMSALSSAVEREKRTFGGPQ